MVERKEEKPRFGEEVRVGDRLGESGKVGDCIYGDICSIAQNNVR